jgi:hypothetical protein
MRTLQVVVFDRPVERAWMNKAPPAVVICSCRCIVYADVRTQSTATAGEIVQAPQRRYVM